MADFIATPGLQQHNRDQMYRDDGDGSHSESRAANLWVWDTGDLEWRKITPDDLGGGGGTVSIGGTVTVVQATATNLKVDASGVAVPVTDNAGSLTVDDGGTPLSVQGNVASDIPVTANPLLAGARASTATPSAVSADGDAVALWASRTGVLQVGDGGGSLTVDGTVTANQGVPPWSVGGNIAHDSLDSGNPVKVGGKANTNAPSPVSTDGDRVNADFDEYGSASVVPALRLAGSDDFGNLGLSWAKARGNVAGPLVVSLMGYNGSTHDRLRGTTDGLQVIGAVAQDAPVAGKPTLIGGRASAAAPTDMSADGDSVYLWTTLKGALNVADGGGSLTVDGPLTDAQLRALAVPVSGTVTAAAQPGVDIGDVTVNNAAGAAAVNIQDGGNTITVDGTVTVGTLPALVAGTANIGDVDVLTLPGSLTGKAEDTASSPADVGIPNLGVRNDTPTALTDTDGDYTMMAVDKYGRTQIAPVRSLPKSIQVSGNLGITTAATWDERAAWTVPASTLFAPKMARCAVTTAATRTLIVAGKRLGTFNPNTNAFVADGSVSGNDFYDRMFYRINVTHSATATTVTATYNDQAGASSTSGGLVIVASAAAGDWYEFVLAAGDFGVQSCTAMSDTAAPNSVTDEIWGVRTLLEDIGPANNPHIAYLGEGLQIPAGESVFILFNAAATTAQVRFASVLGDLVAA